MGSVYVLNWGYGRFGEDRAIKGGLGLRSTCGADVFAP